MGFLDPTDFRWVLPTETDANSPLSEELMSQLRENIESNALNRIRTVYQAKFVDYVGGAPSTQLTITKINGGDADWPTNIAANLILAVKTGSLLGQTFTITANTELTTATAVVTLSTSVPPGLQLNDEMFVLYSDTGFAHTHDGLDSAPVGGIKLEAQSIEVLNDAGTTITNPTYLFYNSTGDWSLVRVGTNNVFYRHADTTKTISGSVEIQSAAPYLNNISVTVVLNLVIMPPKLYNVDSTYYALFDSSGAYYSSNITAPIHGATVTIPPSSWSALPANSRFATIELPSIDVASLALVDGMDYAVAVCYTGSAGLNLGEYNFVNFAVYSSTSAA